MEKENMGEEAGLWESVGRFRVSSRELLKRYRLRRQQYIDTHFIPTCKGLAKKDPSKEA